MRTEGIIDRYRKYLPVTQSTPVISLKEGGTPLILARNLSREVTGGAFEIYLKFEGANPTGSFKDRGMTMAVSKAVEKGVKVIACASTGNTSAAAAAYAASAGIKCVVLLPAGHIALGKLSQALMHGATVVAVDGNFDACLDLVREISAKYPIELVNSVNPMRIEGQKTGAFEIVDELGEAPDLQFMPVGNAGNITAYWKGYKEYHSLGISHRTPRMMGFQAAGSAPIVIGKPVDHPETIATAIRIGNPASWKQAEAARDESGGVIDSVTDDEILDAYKMVAALEGVFCEPASAAGIAGIIKYVKAGKLDLKSGKKKAVCILTGHGLKDPERAIASISKPISVPPTMQAIKQVLGLS